MHVRTLAAGLAFALLTALITPLGGAAVPGTAPAIVVSAASVGIAEPSNSGGAPTAENSATYKVSLSAQPTGTVKVLITGANADFTVAPAELTFTPADFSPKDVTVTATNDTALEGTESFAIAHAVAPAPASTDPDYQGKSATVTANVHDNDFGVAVAHSGGSTTVKEANVAGRTDSFTLALGTAPAGTVTLTLNTPSQLFTSLGTVTFTPANWKVPKTVTVSAAFNDIDQDDRTPNIGYSASSTVATDPYHARTGAIPVHIVEDDNAGYNFGEVANNTLPDPVLEVTEGAATGAAYSIRLTSEPTHPVTITLTPTQVAVNPATLVFGAGNWSIPVTVAVTAVDDLVDEPATNGFHDGSIAQASDSGDGKYDATIAALVPVKVADNDAAGLTVLPATGAALTVSEGSTQGATLTVALNTRPTATVTVATTEDGTSQLSIENQTLAFGAGNWSTPQTVTVRAANDGAGEVTKQVNLKFAASSAGDGTYNDNTAVPDVTRSGITVLDDDGVGVIDLGEDGAVVVAEGGAADTYTLKLAAAPSNGPVTVTLAPNGEFTVSPSTIVFHASQPASACLLELDPPCVPCPLPVVDLQVAPVCVGPPDVAVWNEPQTVTVTAAQDGDIEGLDTTGYVSHTVGAPAGSNFAGTTIKPVPVTVVDDEKALIVKVSGAGTTVSEDGTTQTDTYTVELASPPSFVVDVQPSGSLLAPMPKLRFDAENWNVPQTVVVKGAPDTVDRGDSYLATIAHAVTSAPESGYNGISGANAPSVQVTVVDDDTGSVLATATNDGTTVVEGGNGDNLRVRLSSQPLSPVTVTFTGVAGEVNVLSGAMLTFSTSNWNQEQSVWFQAVDDQVAEESPKPVTVTAASSSSDTAYNGLTLARSIVVVDNDAAGTLVTETSGGTSVTEGGNGDDLRVRLTSKPTADVTVTFSAGSQLRVLTAPLVFTADNWNLPRSSWFQAFDDAAAEGPHSDTVTATLSSDDPFYDGLTISSRTVQIVDND